MPDMTEYMRRLPTTEELIKEIRDARKKKGETAVIVSAKNDEERLKVFLEKLAHQTYRDFDVIIVYGEEDRFLTEFEDKLSILHVRRAKDLGFAGGIFLGQVITYFERYPFFMQLDCDRLLRPKALEILRKSIGGKDMVFGREVPEEDQWAFSCLMRRSVLEKAGFYYVPFFLGGEDTEYLFRRLKTCSWKVIDEVVVEHKCRESDKQRTGLRPMYHMPHWLLLAFYRDGDKILAVDIYTRRLCRLFAKRWVFDFYECENGFLREAIKALQRAQILLGLAFRGLMYTTPEAVEALREKRYVIVEARVELEPANGSNLPELEEIYEAKSAIVRALKIIRRTLLFAWYRGEVVLNIQGRRWRVKPKKRIPDILFLVQAPILVLKWWSLMDNLADAVPKPAELYSAENVRKELGGLAKRLKRASVRKS